MVINFLRVEILKFSLNVDEFDPFSKMTQIVCQMSAIQIKAIQIMLVHWFRKMLMRFTVENIMSAGKKFKAAKFLSVKIISLRWQTKEGQCKNTWTVPTLQSLHTLVREKQFTNLFFHFFYSDTHVRSGGRGGSEKNRQQKVVGDW